MEKVKTFLSGLAFHAQPFLLWGGIFGLALFLSCGVWTGCTRFIANMDVSGAKQKQHTVPLDPCERCKRVCGGISVSTVNADTSPRPQTAQCWEK